MPIKISWKCRAVTDGAGPSTANSGQCCRLAAGFPLKLRCHTRAGGYPVRRAFSVLSPASLEYWVTRRSLSSGGHSADPVAGDDTRYMFAFSRRIAPELCQKFFALEKQRAQGMPDARCTRDLVRNVHRKCAHKHTGEAENIRHSLRNGFTAYNVLSPENGSFASVAP